MDYKTNLRPSEGISLGGLASAMAYMPAPVIIVVIVTRGGVGWGYFLASFTALLGLLSLNVRDLRAVQRNDWDAFTPAVSFFELALAVVACTLLLMSGGPGGPDYVSLLLLPVLAGAVIGDRPFIAAVWATAIIGMLVVVVHAGLGAGDSARFLAAHAAVWAGVAMVVDFVVREHQSYVGSSDALTALASDAGESDSTPGSLAVVAPLVCEALRVDRVAVFGPTDGKPVAELLRWPVAWDGDFGVAERLASDALAGREATVLEGYIAVRSASPTEELVLVVPRRTVRRVPTESERARAVVNLLALRAGRSRQLRGLMNQAMTDPLTGLANRRRLHEELAHAMTHSRRTGEVFSVAMLDLDHFKDFNDRYGHVAGDELLADIAGRLGSAIRVQDLVARYGGEEFAVVLPGSRLADAHGLLDALRTGVRGGGGTSTVTFSAGVAQWDGREDADALLRRADLALYRAKAAGRDRVESDPAA